MRFGSWVKFRILSRQLLPRQPHKFEEARRCVRANQAFFDELLAVFSQEGSPLFTGAFAAAASLKAGSSRASPQAVDKVRSVLQGKMGIITVRLLSILTESCLCRYVLKNMVRDFAEEGSEERSQSYGLMVAELQRQLPVKRLFVAVAVANDTSESNLQALGKVGEGAPPRVLVPGAGLGRLCLDIAHAGYEVQERAIPGKPQILSQGTNKYALQGAEYSFYMLMARHAPPSMQSP